MAIHVSVPPVGYKPHPSQVKLHSAGTRFVSCSAGARGGKTKSAAVEFARRIMQDLQSGKGREPVGYGKRRRPRLHYWIISPTSALLREPIRYMYESLPKQLIVNPFDSNNAMWLINDVLIECKSADNPLALVSVGLNGMWIDEAARLKPEAWRGNLRPRLSDFEGWAIFSSTPLGRNWFYDEIVKRGLDGEKERDVDFANIAWTTADNPHISRTEIEAARRQLPPRYFAREYEASFDAFNGNIYEEWDEKIHVFDEPPPPERFRRCFMGVDFGWNSPGCAVVIGDMGNSRWAIVEELYRSNMIFNDGRLTSNTWVSEIRRMRDKWNARRVFCDPAEPDKIHDLVRNGINAEPADNEVIYGIRQMATALHPVDGYPALIVHKSCENFRREVRSYIWEVDTKTGLFTEYPADNQSDHSLDAARYAMVSAMRYIKLERVDALTEKAVDAQKAAPGGYRISRAGASRGRPIG
jgi:hypothetical protein